MTFKQYLNNKLKEKNEKKGEKKTVLFLDGIDLRAKKAAQLHKMDGLLNSKLLYTTRSEVQEGIECAIIMDEYKDKEKLIKKYLERRKGKEDRKQAEEAIKNKIIFAMLLVELGEVDGVIGGLVNPSAHVLSGAFKVIGPKPGIKTISSVMLMERGNEWYIFTDISVNIMPTKEQLTDIAINASEFAKSIDFKTKVAFLSFSTSGSAVHDRSIFVREATLDFNKKYRPKYTAIGEVQFDSAFSPEVRKQKYKDKGFDKNPTIFVFPSLEAGNIGYKIAQRMAGFGAVGPILTGVNKPVNDLSRGATTEDVYNTALLTALQGYDG